MKLYEVNAAILKAVEVLEDEGGEINETTEAAMSELDSLQMEKKRILEYLAKEVLNIRADREALKTEEERLKARRKGLERKEERIIYILDRECGTKTDLGVATLAYHKSESLEVLDSAKACAWLNDNGYTDCVRILPPEVKKDEVKKLIKNDAKVPGVKLVEKKNPSLK